MVAGRPAGKPAAIDTTAVAPVQPAVGIAADSTAVAAGPSAAFEVDCTSSAAVPPALLQDRCWLWNSVAATAVAMRTSVFAAVEVASTVADLAAPENESAEQAVAAVLGYPHNNHLKNQTF